MKEFNLIVSTFRFAEEDACNEILDFLEDSGDANSICEVSDVSGLVLCSTELNPYIVAESAAKKVREEPWSIRYILRIIPVERVVDTDPELIANVATTLSGEKLNKVDTFRITVEKRHCDSLSSKEIISKVADRIQNKVSLENPNWTILVEVVGKRTGVSVLKENQIFSSIKEKRAL